MRARSTILLALKQFTLEVGVRHAIIHDTAGEYKSSNMRNFCSEIRTTLRLLERGTPWPNKAKFTLRLSKKLLGKI